MTLKPKFPTSLHEDSAKLIRDYFLSISKVDTVLVVNSCARGQAVPESDLDFAILVKPGTTENEIKNILKSWRTYSVTQSTILKYKQSTRFAHLHLDIINGNYRPTIIKAGEPIDYFEIEIGNQICYSAPMDNPGSYFQELQKKWLPYYNDDLRLKRLTMTGNACIYDLEHIPVFIQRELYFQAFDILYKAFQEYLQALFIANKIYPIAYNKWIKEQVVKWLNKPDLYPKLLPVLSVINIESNEINEKAKVLQGLLADVTDA
ncbi:MAG TPA: nucleotidyltransferase domain-containing protein [Hanamia sp.]|nr:nucleotidyltransferase domain-containing protein [Hanamia sp.]